MTVSFRVFDPTGQTVLGELSQVIDWDFLDEMNATGAGSLSVPLDSADAALLTRDAVVKCFYEGTARFAWIVERVSRQTVGGGNTQVLQVNGRGVLAWLEDAVVYPQGGLTMLASTERPFSFASEAGGWESSATWAAPQAVVWRSDTSARAGNPTTWPDPAASWVWATSPTTANVPRGTVNYFRKSFTLATSGQVKFWATADSQFELWLNGTLILSSSQFSTDISAWSQYVSVVLNVPAGTHRLAAFVRSGQPWSRADVSCLAATDVLTAAAHGLVEGAQVKVLAASGSNGLTVGTTYFLRTVTTDTFKLATTNSDATIVNITADSTVDLEQVVSGTAGFLMSAATLDSAGNPATVVARSDTTWTVTATEPYWRPGLILQTLVNEAKARGVYRLTGVDTTSFSISADTGGDSWTETTSLNLRVGATLLDVHNELVEQNVDFRIRASDLRLEAYNALGEDLTASARLEPGNAVVQLGTAVERQVKTLAVVRTPTGWATGSVGGNRRETYLESGGTTSAQVARGLAETLLARTGVPLESADAVSIVARPGFTPYVDFTVGDVIGIPNSAGTGWERARIVSLAARGAGNGVEWSMELSILNGTSGMRRPPRLWEQQVASRLRAISPGADLGAIVTGPTDDPGSGGDGSKDDIVSLNPPSTPAVNPMTSGIQVVWDGLDSSGNAYPKQAFVLIYVGTSSGFTPSASNLKGVLYDPGVFPIAGLTPNTAYYVKLRGGTEKGVRSTDSGQGAATALTVAAQIGTGEIGSGQVSFNARSLGGITQTVGTTFPTSAVVGDTFIRTTDGTYWVYQSSGWTQQDWGQGSIRAGAIDTLQLAALAITADKIEANAVTADKIQADAINGKTITGAIIQTDASTSVNRIVLNGSGDKDKISWYNSSNARYYIQVSGTNLIIDASAGMSGGAFTVNTDIDAVGVKNSASTSVPNMRINTSTGRMSTTTHANSAQRFKHEIVPLTDGEFATGVDAALLGDAADQTVDPFDVLSLVPVQFRRNEEPGTVVTGFIAEDVEAKFPTAATYDEDGVLEAIDPRAILAALLAVVQSQQATIADLSARVTALET